MPLSARLLEVGGIALFWGFKVLVVAGAAALLIAAARKVREEDHRLSRLTFRLSLVAVQAVTVCTATSERRNVRRESRWSSSRTLRSAAMSRAAAPATTRTSQPTQSAQRPSWR